MMSQEIYSVLVQMAVTAGLAIPLQSVPLDDRAWVLFFTRLREHVA